MKYRLMFAHTGEPDSDWSEDAEHFHRYIATRPEGIAKLIVVDEDGNEVIPATAEDEVETVDFRPDRRVAHYRIVLIDTYAPTAVVEWLCDLPMALRHCEQLERMTRGAGTLSAFVIDANQNVVDADGPHPAPDWLRQALDEAEQEHQKFEQKFEDAAEAAAAEDEIDDGSTEMSAAELVQARHGIKPGEYSNRRWRHRT
jgi:hypothetical protein